MGSGDPRFAQQRNGAAGGEITPKRTEKGNAPAPSTIGPLALPAAKDRCGPVSARVAIPDRRRFFWAQVSALIERDVVSGEHGTCGRDSELGVRNNAEGDHAAPLMWTGLSHRAQSQACRIGQRTGRAE